MPLPNETVVNALFESYLSMRKDQWGLEDKEGKLNPTQQKDFAEHKIRVCAEILRPVSGYLSSKGWVDLIGALYDQEKMEEEYLNKQWFYRRWMGSNLLLETLKAARSYILSTISDSSYYMDHIQKLQKEKDEAATLYDTRKNHPAEFKADDIAKAEQRFTAAVNALKPFDLGLIKHEKQDHLTYFQNHIQKQDPRAIELSEKSFDDFAKNAADYKRRRELVTKLLETANAAKAAAEKATETAAPKKAEVTTVQPKVETKTVVPFVPPIAPAVLPVTVTAAANPVIKTEPRRSTRLNKKDDKSALQKNSAFSTTDKSRSKNPSRYYMDSDSDSSEEYISKGNRSRY